MYVLAIDCGTQSLRAIIFNQKGALVAKEKMTFDPYLTAKPGYVEQDSTMFYDIMCQALGFVLSPTRKCALSAIHALQGLSVTGLASSASGCLVISSTVVV